MSDQKESVGSSIFEVWNKHIFSLVAKMFFLQSKQMRASSYTGAWYKNV